jgi:energy-coupling factor transporter ATP-binding protein EcfA2
MNDVVEGLPSGAWSLLGLELWGSGPLGHVRLPLVPDRISVLYGLNGAGKSTVLAAVRSALRGTCDESPFLERFRIHAELQDPHRDDPLTTFVRRSLPRLFGGMRLRPGSGTPEQPRIRPETLPPVTEALRFHLARVVEDPACTPMLADQLAVPNGTHVPLRITVTGDARRGTSIALAARPDGSSFRLLWGLLAQAASSEPADPIVLGSPMAAVWDAIARATDPESVFHPGPKNLELLERADVDTAAAFRRALVERWVSDWLFAGEFPYLASPGVLTERWQSVPVTDVGPGILVKRPNFEFAVASDADEVLASATTIVRSIGGLDLARPSSAPGSSLTHEQEEEQRRWTMRQYALHVEPEIIRAMRDAGELDVLPEVRPFPNSPRRLSMRQGGQRGNLEGGGNTHMRTSIGAAVRAANMSIREWASEYIPLPSRGFREGPIVDRISDLRDPSSLHPVEDDTLELRLGSLSTAQERWVTVAMSFLARREWHPESAPGVARPGISPHVVLLLDEPERSLHRGAERDVLRRLERLVAEENATAFIATHSPVILDADAVVLHHVRMVDDRISVRSEVSGETSLDEIARRIGARRSDVASLRRVFVLVEGEVDRAVLEGLFGDELKALRASIVPMFGTDALHTAVTPHGLLGQTDASVVILLDHVDHERMDEVRRELERRVAVDGSASARRWLDRRFDRTPERATAALLANALEHGELERVTIVGIPAVDILELIPFDLLGCGRPREAFDAAVAGEVAAGRRWTSTRTKQWLTDGGADVSVDGVRDAVSRMDVVPPELLRLLEVVRASADRARSIAGGAPPVADEA